MEDLETLDPEGLLYLAGLAEQSERYDDMTRFVCAFAKKADRELSSEERNQVSVAYKNSVGTRRHRLRVLRSIEGKEETHKNPVKAARTVDYRRETEQELAYFCQQVIDLIDHHLLPHTTSPEGRVLYCRMKADYYRDMCEFARTEVNDENAESALASYQSAFDTAIEGMPPTHPTRLGLILSLATYQYEVLQDHQKACEMAKRALDAALSDLDNVPEQQYRDATLIMQLLRDNLAFWTYETREAADTD